MKPQKKAAPLKTSASWQAQTAFYLSLTLAAFQFYQYFHAQSEAVVAASIDLGRKHLTDPDIAAGRGVAINMMMSPSPAVPADEKAAAAWNQYMLEAEYMARLLSKGRLDSDYLTTVTICDIWLASVAAFKLPSRPNQISPLHDFAKPLSSECVAQFPNLPRQ